MLAASIYCCTLLLGPELGTQHTAMCTHSRGVVPACSTSDTTGSYSTTSNLERMPGTHQKGSKPRDRHVQAGPEEEQESREEAEQSDIRKRDQHEQRPKSREDCSRSRGQPEAGDRQGQITEAGGVLLDRLAARGNLVWEALLLPPLYISRGLAPGCSRTLKSCPAQVLL